MRDQIGSTLGVSGRRALNLLRAGWGKSHGEAGIGSAITLPSDSFEGEVRIVRMAQSKLGQVVTARKYLLS